MEWFLAGVVVVALVAFWRWRQGADERRLARERARSEMFRGLMADRALDARADRRPPVELPALSLPLAWVGPSRATAHAANDGMLWLLYDTQVYGPIVRGCNNEPRQTSEGEDPARFVLVSRHTVVAVRSDDVELPAFTLVPNEGAVVVRALEEMSQTGGLSGLVARKARSYLPDDATAIAPAPAFPRDRGFADAFELSPASETGVRALFDAETTTLLLAHPWAIVEARGPWLFVSRSVSPAVSSRPEEKPYGLLSRGSAAELFGFAERLVGRLHGRI